MQDRPIHEFLHLPDPYQQSDAIEFVTELAPARPAAGTGLACAVVETATGGWSARPTCGCPTPRRTAAEIGYLIYAPARGHGYAAEASRPAAWAFAHGVERVEIRCAVANLASAKSALNAGFRFEGVLRGELATPGRSRPTARVFGRLPGDSDGAVQRTVRAAAAGRPERRHPHAAGPAARRRGRDPGTGDRPAHGQRRVQRRRAHRRRHRPADAAGRPGLAGRRRGRVRDARRGQRAGGRLAAVAPGRSAERGRDRLRGAPGLPRPRLHHPGPAPARAVGLRHGGFRPPRTGRQAGQHRLAAGRTARPASSPTASAGRDCATSTARSPTRCASRWSIPGCAEPAQPPGQVASRIRP